MIRFFLSFAAAAVLATSGWSAFGKAISPAQPQLLVIAHVYAHAHRTSVSTLHTAGAQPGRLNYQ